MKLKYKVGQIEIEVEETNWCMAQQVFDYLLSYAERTPDIEPVDIDPEWVQMLSEASCTRVADMIKRELEDEAILDSSDDDAGIQEVVARS